MREYIKEHIYNNKINADDIREGRTGFKYWDSLDQEKRSQLMQESHASWQSMTPKERAKVIFKFEAEIRKKRRADNGKLKGVDNYDVIREIVNVDISKMIEEELLSDLDRRNELELLAKLKGKTITDTIVSMNAIIEEMESPN
jgi:hypothetical protein